MLGLNWRAKQVGRDRRHLGPLLREATAPSKGSRRADELQSLRRQPVPHTADQQRHVGALTATVGVKLIQDEKAQPLSGLD